MNLRVVVVEMILHKFMLSLSSIEITVEALPVLTCSTQKSRVQLHADMVWSEFWIHDKISSNVKFKITRFSFQISGFKSKKSGISGMSDNLDTTRGFGVIPK